MNLVLVLGILIWLLIMLAGPIAVYFNATKPFSTLQKVGMLVSMVALISVFVLPVMSWGALNLSFADTLKWMGDRSSHNAAILCNYYVPVFLTMFIFAPVISATLYMSNIGKKLAGILLLLSPIYLALLSNFSNLLKDMGLASGSIVYLICGIVLIALPWFIRDENVQAFEKKRLAAIVIAMTTIVGFAPSLWIQLKVKQNEQAKEQQNEVSVQPIEGVEEVEVEKVAESEDFSEIEEENGGNAMTSVSADACFVQGLSNIAKYSPHRLASGEYSKAVIPQMYMYESKRSFFIRAGKHNGSFALTLSGGSVRDWNLDLGDLFDVINIDGSTEFYFGQSDINSDGYDELIVAGRTIQEGGNRICVNVYNMRGEADKAVQSIHNKTAYNATGIAFVEPSNGERSGYIEIGEGEAMKHKETWVLQDNFLWVKLDD